MTRGRTERKEERTRKSRAKTVKPAVAPATLHGNVGPQDFAIAGATGVDRSGVRMDGAREKEEKEDKRTRERTERVEGERRSKRRKGRREMSVSERGSQEMRKSIKMKGKVKGKSNNKEKTILANKTATDAPGHQ